MAGNGARSRARCQAASKVHDAPRASDAMQGVARVGRAAGTAGLGPALAPRYARCSDPVVSVPSRSLMRSFRGLLASGLFLTALGALTACGDDGGGGGGGKSTGGNAGADAGSGGSQGGA